MSKVICANCAEAGEPFAVHPSHPSVNPFRVVRDFEAALCAYTGAPYAVTVNSCTMALLLACVWNRKEFEYVPDILEIPSVTYPSVPMSIRHAGYRVAWTQGFWEGSYQLYPSPIRDCALRFTSGMYVPGQVQCVSFHARKLLKIGSGGAILHDDAAADAWYRKARFDGRTEGVPTAEDTYEMLGYHCYMFPEQAARGLHLLSYYPKHMPDQPKDAYPDLSRWPIFQTR